MAELCLFLRCASTGLSFSHALPATSRHLAGGSEPCRTIQAQSLIWAIIQTAKHSVWHLHLRAVPDAFLMESDGRTLCLHMLIRKPTGNSHISGDTKQGPNKQGLAKAVCTVFVVAEHFKQSRNMNCLNLVTTAFWATLFDRPCSVFSEYIMTTAVKKLCYIRPSSKSGFLFVLRNLRP